MLLTLFLGRLELLAMDSPAHFDIPAWGDRGAATAAEECGACASAPSAAALQGTIIWPHPAPSRYTVAMWLQVTLKAASLTALARERQACTAAGGPLGPLHLFPVPSRVP